MIRKASDIKKTDRVGAKAQALSVLKKNGFRVPDFVGIPIEALREVFADDGQRTSELEQELQKSVSWKVSVVRSSMLGEDERFASHAGEFSTELRVSHQDLLSAIRKVWLGSKGRVGSVIVQQFIEPDCSGVCFTRDPEGMFGMRINYVEGHSESLVSGKSQGQDLRVFSANDLAGTPLPAKAFEVFKNIEALFQMPQDIEWLLKDGNLFIVQSRPITTLDDAEVAGFRMLDGEQFKPGYFFESLNVAAGLPEHPAPLMKSIFEMIYENQGAVHAVYSEMGCNVSGYQTPLADFGGHLFIDRDREVKNVFPSYAYRNSFSNPKPVQFSGFFTGIKNGMKINKFLAGSPREDMRALKNHFGATTPGSIDAWHTDFSLRYRDIYRISLRARHALEVLGKISREKSIPMEDMLSLTSLVLGEEHKVDIDTEGWIGNGLDIADTMPFKKSEIGEPHQKMKEWFSNQDLKTSEIIKESLKILYYREYARWSAVQSMQFLRTILWDRSKDTQISSTDFYFTTLDSLMHGTWTREAIEKAKETHIKEDRVRFPARISDIHVDREKSLALVIADGVFSGLVVSREALESDPSLSGCIVVTETLDPKLAGYLDRIAGVISVNGSYLAHFAIIARESHIPTVVIGDRARSFIGKQLDASAQSLGA